ncbi:unnamed protein product [Cyprideis torosa]|uniref:Cep192-like domain-containing protein n=1 Tax=Cyprideis torosa TaxID=163714 RepID=A0A7R8ZFN8_9CRUS|nr:unnamed protein product [Cyprideis torosa]CAG0879551.1 unnamed protein product [Cyprideis torosa]
MREERMPLIQDRVPSNLQRATSEYGSSTNGGGQVQAVRMGIRIFIITLVARRSSVDTSYHHGHWKYETSSDAMELLKDHPDLEGPHAEVMGPRANLRRGFTPPPSQPFRLSESEAESAPLTAVRTHRPAPICPSKTPKCFKYFLGGSLTVAAIFIIIFLALFLPIFRRVPPPVEVLNDAGELNTTIAPPSASSQVTVPSTIEVTPVTSEVAPSSTAEVTVPSTVEVTPVASEVNAPSSTEVNASSSASISAQPVISSSTELSDGPASTTPLKDSVPGLIIVPDDTNPKKLPAPLALPVLQAALSQALQGAQKQLEQTRDAIRTGKVVQKGSPSAKHGHRLRPVLPPAKQKHWQALALNLASQEIAKVAKDNNITTDDDFWDSLPQVGPPDTCDLDPEPIVCDEDAVKYRRVDGRCNNLRNPLWGSTMSTYRRLLPPDYADGVGLPRVASDGTDLPSARTVRTTVHPNQYHGSAFFTNIAMVWGQIVDHDVTLTNSFSVAPAGVRKQSNGQTSFLDGSIIYGSTVEQQVIVRAFSEGKMLITNSDEGTGDLLPVSKELNDGCNKEDEFSKGNYCFLSGDLRVNEMLSLASVHTLLVREHNRVATELLRLNPSWDDEKTYQEARKIVSAQIQHITYNELLPIILGKNLSKYNIDLAPAGTYFEGYDDDADPTITAAFAAAAYRFGHSMIQGLVKLDRQMNGSREVDWIQLKDLLFHPFSLHQPGTMDAVLRGQVDQETQEVDPYFTNQFQERRPPYRLSSSPFRVDLHQGSDHQTFIRFASSTLGLCSDRLILRCRADGHPPSKYAVELHGIPRSFNLVVSVRNPFRGGSAEVGQIFVDVVNNGRGIAFCHALVFEDESCSLVARGLSLEPRHCLLRPRETATFIVTPPPPSHGDTSSLLSSATLFLLSGEEIGRQEFKRSLAAAGRPAETSPDLRRARLEPPSILAQFEIMRGSSSSPCLLAPPESSLKALTVNVAADILAEGLTGLKQILFNPDDVLKTLDTLDDTIVP